MIEQWKPTTAGGHHVRNVVRDTIGWRGEVCLRPGGPHREHPGDWQVEVWHSDGTYFGASPKSDLDLISVDETRQESVGPATNEGAIMSDWKERIKQWAEDRNLIEGSTPWKQVRKLIEETEELATALHENNVEETKDAIGDIQVVLAVMCAQLGIDIDECREIAWNEIKDRKGRMIDGVFVKEVQGE